MAAAAVERPGAPPPPPQQRFQGIQKESAGYKLMSAMGWQEGEGLGASKQGIKAHIKVKKKFENWGVGAVEAAEHAQNWTNGMLDFHRVLSSLAEVVSEHAKRRSDSSSSEEESGSDASSSDSEEEESDASGSGGSSSSDEEEEAVAAAVQQKGPSAKKRKAAAAAAAEAEAAAAAPKRVRAATHVGRFKKREAGKMVKGYSEHDLAAILGSDPFAAMAAAVPEVRAQRQASSSGYESDSDPSGSDEDSGKQRRSAVGKAKGGRAAAAAQQQQQQQQQPERPPMIVVRRPMPAMCRPPQPPTPPESQQPGWWNVCFHKATGPKGVGAQAAAAVPEDAKPAAITIHGFSEQDQTNLYMMAHDKATKGRVGLGRSSMPKKVAGARWEGKKTRIGDSDEEGSDGELSAEEAVPLFTRQEGTEVGPAPGGVELEREEGLVIILPVSKRHLLDSLPHFSADQQQQTTAAPATAPTAPAADSKPAGKKAKKAAVKAAAAAAAAAAAEEEAAKQQQQAQAQQQPPAAAAEAPADAVGRIKWKKAVGAALKASTKGKIKLSKLSKAIAKEQGVPKAQSAAAFDALTAFLQKSSKFSLADGVVRAV